MDQLETHYFMCHSHCSCFPICLSLDRTRPLHTHCLCLGEKSLSHCEKAFSFWLPGLDVTSRKNTLSCLAYYWGQESRAWTKIEEQAAVTLCPWSREQDVCTKLTAPGEPQGPATQLPSQGPLTLMSAETFEWSCLGGSLTQDTIHHAWAWGPQVHANKPHIYQWNLPYSLVIWKNNFSWNSSALFLMRIFKTEKSKEWWKEIWITCTWIQSLLQFCHSFSICPLYAFYLCWTLKVTDIMTS